MNADAALHQLATLIRHAWMEAMLQHNLCNCTQRVNGPIAELPEQAVSNPNTGSCSSSANDHHLDLPQDKVN